MYSQSFGIPGTVFRFFSVYGPWINPDLAPFKFLQNLTGGRPTDLFNHGDTWRDFIYIDDLVDGIMLAFNKRSLSLAPDFELFNIGTGKSVSAIELIRVLEKVSKKTPQLNLIEHPSSCMHQTLADIKKISDFCGFRPKTSMEDGIQALYDWYVKWNSNYSQSNSDPQNHQKMAELS